MSESVQSRSFKTSSGIPVDPVYGPNSDRSAALGTPGEYPYTRGIQPTMYRGRLWTMRQYAGMGDAEESNRRYKFLLAHGRKGSRWHSICRRRLGTTRILHWHWARWERLGWRSIRSRTWSGCSMEFGWTRSPP